jgi:hypothetical protein
LTDTLPEDPFSSDPPNVWLTSFWGFSPDVWGFLGFTQESDRDSFLRKSRPGCLVTIYVTKQSMFDRALRGRIAGFLQVSHEIGHAREFMPGDAYVAKERDAASAGKWNFGVRVVRAWRVSNSLPPLIEEFAPATYGTAHPQRIGGQGVAFAADEARKLLDIDVFEVPVYGSRSTFDPHIRRLGEQLRASKAVPRSTSPYIVDEIDGPKKLYVLLLNGSMPHFLGPHRDDVEEKIVVKVGYSMSPEVRCYAFNRSMPKCAFEWSILKTNEGPPPFPNYRTAQAGEDEMKRSLAERGADSLGGEFYLTTMGDVLHAWHAGQRAATEYMAKRTSRDP